ncbi:MAG: 23S rRNA (guanosine(2251)-2'-O)-methyltransferase RlmB, partial [Alphaproteobacteria bacterium]|nr:23S rRNA (guanosine(2251)-2'-O)-methyltransferase RlmB [Alphaproteobacteria bacterium]
MVGQDGRAEMTRRPPPKDRSAPERGRRAPAPPSDARGPFRPASPDLVALYGAHPVRAALTARKRKLLALYATETALPRIRDLAAAAGLAPRLVDSRDLERRLGAEAVHQGLMLEARPLPEADISDIVNVSGIVLALDQITDPHNVGAT